MQALIERGVVGDYREPGILRFGLPRSTSRHVDIWDAAAALVDVLDSGAGMTTATGGGLWSPSAVSSRSLAVSVLFGCVCIARPTREGCRVATRPTRTPRSACLGGVQKPQEISATRH